MLGFAAFALGAASLRALGLSPDAPSAPQPAGRAAPASPPTLEPLRYGRDVRPILSDRCFLCHGPDASQRQAGLRLDERESAVAAREGGAAIVPGDPDHSQLWRRVNAHDAADRMPPPSSPKPALSPEQREILRRWISEGATYEPHWAFTPPTRPPEPAVANTAWVRNPIDRFILAGLESRNLHPNPEAEPADLLRRVFLDLTGLPPTPEELDAYLADARPDRYERWVDKLLTEEPYRTRYAERMAVPWLDAARYADTSGIHMDAGRSIWPYRDWVLRAFRDNLPFDRFTIDQIAGDLLPEPTLDQIVATGFNRSHVTSDEGGAIAEEYLVEYVVDRVSTTGAVFLGMTVGCGRCHDHKFDPISQQEFYGLFAYFNSIEEPGLYSQVPDPQRALEPFLAVPSADQSARQRELAQQVADAQAEATRRTPREAEEFAEFLAQTASQACPQWSQPDLLAAESRNGATLTQDYDGSVVAAGPNPDTDVFVLTYRTDATDARLIALEALDGAGPDGKRVGRGENGNAVLSWIEVESTSVADRERKKLLRFDWAWANVEQGDGDFALANALDPGPDGWAVAAHQVEGSRLALFLTDEPLGFEGGAEVQVRLHFESIYARHVFERVRISFGTVDEAFLDKLPETSSHWLLAGPFPAERREDSFAVAYGPETDTLLDRTRSFPGGAMWRYFAPMRDGVLTPLEAGNTATYLGKRIYSPSERRLRVSLGSDDGIRVFVNGADVFSRETDRGLLADQDRAEFTLRRGMNTVVLKIANTGGPGGAYYRPLEREDLFEGALAAVLAPPAARGAALDGAIEEAWLAKFSPRRRELAARINDLRKQQEELTAQIPLTMVMKELDQPRPTFVLKRGQYDHPDRDRPAQPGIPAALGKLPEGAPANRLGLAQWLVSAENPLVARVTVNRLWEQLFGAGLVRTSQDFGLQGEWPSHPELLDWLAVEFREGGWDVRAMMRLLATSATYRQSARRQQAADAVDPENRLLSYYPRQRLGAEAIRDQALYVAGLLVETFGGPSVKPYQPEGLWQEVAMPQSNTRVYERGKGADLWRRSLYTYWKRAAPPPAMLAFDAPTRESCVVRRSATNTPLQALALWNDEQMLEAARVLAARTLREAPDDGARLERLLRRCTGRAPTPPERVQLEAALRTFRQRYRAAEADAAKVLKVGEAPQADGLSDAELAAWTLVASAVLSSDATISKD